MDDLILTIGNKNYSSWSFRPWIALTACGVTFTEQLIPFDFPGGNPQIKAISPTGRVPLLQHGKTRVWESLAIIEYVHELFPAAGLWPADTADRAVARSISMEMLSGFSSLRGACPMNMHRQPGRIELPSGVAKDIERISAIWKEMRVHSGGPFLFGAFTAADAMFAPVVSRFEVYELSEDLEVLAYMAAMKAHPAWKKWQDAALHESWVVEEDEV